MSPGNEEKQPKKMERPKTRPNLIKETVQRVKERPKRALGRAATILFATVAPHLTASAQTGVEGRELLPATPTPATVAEVPAMQETVPFPLYTQDLGQLNLPQIDFANPTEEDTKEANDFLATLSNNGPYLALMGQHEGGVEDIATQEGKNKEDYAIQVFFDDSAATTRGAAMILRKSGEGADRAYFFNQEKSIFEFIDLFEGEKPGIFRYTSEDGIISLVPGVLTKDEQGNPAYLIFGFSGGELSAGGVVEPTKTFEEAIKVAAAPETTQARVLSTEELQAEGFTSGVEFEVDNHTVRVVTNIPGLEVNSADPALFKQELDIVGVGLASKKYIVELRNIDEFLVDWKAGKVHPIEAAEKDDQPYEVWVPSILGEDNTTILKVFIDPQILPNFNRFPEVEGKTVSILSAHITGSVLAAFVPLSGQNMKLGERVDRVKPYPYSIQATYTPPQ